MKKQITLLLIYFLIFASAALVSAQDPTPTASPTPEPTITPTPEPTNITVTPTPEPTNITVTPTPEPTVTTTPEPTNTTTASPQPTNGTTITIPSIPEFGRLEATTIMIGVTTALAVAFTVVKKRKTPLS
jgi:hypothetical protein